MKTYKVNADFLINVSTWVEAEDEDEAEKLGMEAILSKDCEWQDPCDTPKINWVEEVE